MKKEYELSFEDQQLKMWLEERSEMGLSIAKVEKAAIIPPGIIARFLKGERKQLGKYNEVIICHLEKYFGYKR